MESKLVQVLAGSAQLNTFTKRDWSNLLLEARYHRMASQLGRLLKASAPEEFLAHIKADQLAYQKQLRILAQETKRFSKLFSAAGVDCVYLKGSAYQLRQFEEFQGRLMADIDILVNQADLKKVEAALKKEGWVNHPHTDYDERYYREWSQEIPPLIHYVRRTELDVHFNLLPLTLKEAPDQTKLFASKEPLAEQDCAYTLNPEAMVLHSAIHLFYESEFPKGLRDLHDIHMLLLRFSKQPGFWQKLIEIQSELGNGQSIYLACRYCIKIFNTQIPDAVLQTMQQWAPSPIALRVLDIAFQELICRGYPPLRSWYFSFAEKLLYLRGHLKRMPLHLLLPHLIRKSIYRLKERSHEPEEDLLF